MPTPRGLEGLAITIHTRSAAIIGEAFWDLHAPNPDASDVLHEIDALRHEYRVRGVRYLADLAWRMAGGQGEPPEELMLIFAIHLSGFATHALMTDFDQTPAQTGVLSAEILRVALARALDAQRAPADAPAPSPDKA